MINAHTAIYIKFSSRYLPIRYFIVSDSKMFGNLKHKLGEVADLKKFTTPQILSSLTSSRQQSVNHSPGSDTPIRLKHSRQSSNASQNGLLTATGYSSISLEHIKEKELLSEIKKLKAALEDQEKGYQDSLTMKEQEWLARVQEEERKASSLERQFINVREHEKLLYKQLKEKESLASANYVSSTHFEGKCKETEKQLETLQDNYDQLEGLGTQEVAKIKHLLLDTSTQLESVTKELAIRTDDLETLRKELLIVSATANKYTSLVEDKMEQDTTVAGLRQKLNLANLRIVTSEKESEDKLEQMQEKLSVLENRIKQESFQDDDRIKALTEERETLDHLLEEKRQELNNIKMSWSEKIYNLENQILSLNKKMAEDQMEIKYFEETVDRLTKEREQLNTQSSYSKEIQNKEIEQNAANISQLEEDLANIKLQNEDNITAKEKEINEARKHAKIKDEEIVQLNEAVEAKDIKLAEFEELYNERINDLGETNIKLTTLEEAYKVLKLFQESIANSYSTEKESCKNLEQELCTVTSKYETVLSEKQKLSVHLDHLSNKVVSLETELASATEENYVLNTKFSEAKQNSDEYQNGYEQATRLLKEAERDFEQMISQSDLVKMLKQQCNSLEDELVDTKQKFKVQKQRMDDMKKTLQKELRISSSNLDSMSETNIVNIGERTSCTNESRSELTEMAAKKDIYPSPSDFSMNDLEYINISYLKHVLLKFMTSRESEAIQLVRAIGALLHMTTKEEKMLEETMRWKMSWFGSKPNLGKGQTAKAIPPSQ